MYLLASQVNLSTALGSYGSIVLMYISEEMYWQLVLVLCLYSGVFTYRYNLYKFTYLIIQNYSIYWIIYNYIYIYLVLLEMPHCINQAEKVPFYASVFEVNRGYKLGTHKLDFLEVWDSVHIWTA